MTNSKHDDPTTPTGLPGGKHDPESGRAALVIVRSAISELRPDVAATVLTTALSELALMIPADRRRQYVDAIQTMMQTQLLKAALS